ncbi:MAG: hypothetical protein ACFFBP_07015 [Promethearchaeota archaeon]
MFEKLKTSQAAITVFPFGIYLMILGTIIAIHPALLLSLAGIEHFDVIARLMGMLTVICGYFYTRCALEGIKMQKFFWFTTHTRSVQIIVVVLFIIFAEGNLLLLGFSIVDLAACIWTIFALRKDKKKEI